MADPSSEEELSTSDEEDANAEVSAEDVKCPPKPDSQDDPTEEELLGAAEKLETMMARVQPPANIFFTPSSLGAQPALWLQAKLTISLLPGCLAREVCQTLPHHCCGAMAERTSGSHCQHFSSSGSKCYDPLSRETCKYICSLGAATETVLINRSRTPSSPGKVTVTTQPHERPHGGVNFTRGVSALLAWFPASWASTIAPCFLTPQGGAPQHPQVTIPCPTRETPGLHKAFYQNNTLLRTT